MPNEPGGGRYSTDRESTTDERHLTGAVLEAELPTDLATSLGRLLDEKPVETLRGWVDAVTRHTDGGIAVDDLCHAEDTPHWGEVDGDRYHFQCFFDAVVLAALTDDAVDVRTESPDGTVVEARAIGTDELTTVPATAVLSIGVDTQVSPPDGGPTLDRVYAAMCPYVRAFPDVPAYEQWQQTVPAATVAMPLAEATVFAAALA